MEPSAGLERQRKTYLGLGTGAFAVGALAYVGIADPHRPGSFFPPCPFKLLTGWNCPACGGLRMTYDLLHGNLAAAVTDNVFLLTALPALALVLLWRRRTGRPLVTKALYVLVIVAAIAWTVLRNMPGFPLVPTMSDG